MLASNPMPRPKVERVPLAIRPPRTIYEPFEVTARAAGLSIAAAVEEAMRVWGGHAPAPRVETVNARAVSDLSFALARPATIDRQPTPKKGKQ